MKENSGKEAHLKECALVFDSMMIRKQLVWDDSKKVNRGYVDVAQIVSAEVDELAREALVFQIVSYRKRFKCPVAYFLVNKIPVDLLTTLIKTCIVKLYEVGVVVRTVTCDGAYANIQALRNLGCKLETESIISHFKHPSFDCNVHAILDPCHMMKLVRNTLADKKVISTVDGEVKWDYIVSLHSLQESEGLKFANSISKQHINFFNKKMNVSLAAQTLSSSVADTIEFLDFHNHPDFHGLAATVAFIRKIDKLFDILNSRNVFGKGFKQPLRLENMNFIQNYFAEMEAFLKSVSIDGVPILSHPRKTFVFGFLMCMKSIGLLVPEFLYRENDPFSYFLPYKVSQDHIELLFSCIRARGGWNNNPNCIQFQSALKSLLLKKCYSRLQCQCD